LYCDRPKIGATGLRLAATSQPPACQHIDFRPRQNPLLDKEKCVAVK
jgi:hypothetical protein